MKSQTPMETQMHMDTKPQNNITLKAYARAYADKDKDEDTDTHIRRRNTATIKRHRSIRKRVRRCISAVTQRLHCI